MKIFSRSLLFVIVATLAGFGCSQEKNEGPSLFSSLQQDGVLELVLEAPLSDLVENKESEERRPARLTVQRPSGQSVYDIEVRPRGNMRKRYCSFPPLKLYFDEEALSAEGFSGHDEIKLVAHCQEDGEPWLLKEYLAYRLYNELSGRSFQVQLARILYRDSEGRMPDESRYAFLIEPKADLAGRVDGEIIEPADGLNIIGAEQYRQFVLFQYMIGNTDWSLQKGHNVEILQVSGDSAPTPVPYDFDNAGLVDADYAIPHPSLPISDVSQRLFQWRGKSLEGFGDTAEHFISRKGRLLAVVEQFEYLDEADKRQMLQYMESFFRIIEQNTQGEDWAGILNQPSGWS